MRPDRSETGGAAWATGHLSAPTGCFPGARPPAPHPSSCGLGRGGHGQGLPEDALEGVLRQYKKSHFNVNNSMAFCAFMILPPPLSSSRTFSLFQNKPRTH